MAVAEDTQLAALVEQAVALQLASLEERLEQRLGGIESRLAKLEQCLSSAGALSVRDVVRIDGLDNIAHLSLNGKKAQLRNWEGPGGRWVVQVLQTGELKSLRCENLVPAASAGPGEDDGGASHAAAAGDGRREGGDGSLAAGDVVEVQGLRRQAQLNGARAEVLSWDDAAGRWLVRLVRGKERKQLRTSNLRRIGEAVRVDLAAMGGRVANAEAPAAFEPGTLVRLQGLKSEDLNGLRARVQRWDPNAKRCVVQLLETREEKSLKEENLLELDGTPRAGQVATIEGLGQAPQLNGQAAELLKWDPEKSRWNMRLIDSDDTKLLRPENLTALPWGQFVPGCSAIMTDTQGAEGQRCTVMRWEAVGGKWVVLPDALQGKLSEERRLRPRQLRMLARGSQDDAGQEDGAAEVLGGSSDEEGGEYSRAGVLAGDVLQEGSVATIGGLGSRLDGQKVRLVAWKDVGGPFGQWDVQVLGTGEVLTLHPGCLEAVASDE